MFRRVCLVCPEPHVVSWHCGILLRAPSKEELLVHPPFPHTPSFLFFNFPMETILLLIPLYSAKALGSDCPYMVVVPCLRQHLVAMHTWESRWHTITVAVSQIPRWWNTKQLHHYNKIHRGKNTFYFKRGDTWRWHVILKAFFFPKECAVWQRRQSHNDITWRSLCTCSAVFCCALEVPQKAQNWFKVNSSFVPLSVSLIAFQRWLQLLPSDPELGCVLNLTQNICFCALPWWKYVHF